MPVRLYLLLLLRTTASRSRLSAMEEVARWRARANGTASRALADAPPKACGAAGRRGDVAMCAPPAAGCARPDGFFFLYLRQCAGFVVGKGLLDALVPPSSIAWAECFSLAHAKTAAQLADARARGWVAMTALRNPVARLAAQFFATFDLATNRAEDLPEWVRSHSRPTPRRGNDGTTTLWVELDNLYVKALSAWDGAKPACDAAHGDRGCLGGVDRASLAAAKAALEREFDLVVVVEWLHTPPTVALLGARLCFEHERGVVTRRVRPSYSRAPADAPPDKPVPDLRHARCKRYGKGEARAEAFRAQRFPNASWWTSPPVRGALAELERRNAYDIELFEWAAERVRKKLTAHWRETYPGAPMPQLPALPCTPGALSCWDGERAPLPRDIAMATH